MSTGKNEKISLDAKPNWRELWDAVRPSPGLLILGFVGVLLNRAAGFALPASAKYLVDDILATGKWDKMGPLAIAVFAATLIQAGTTLLLMRALSAAGQRMMASYRKRLHDKLLSLSVSFFDSSRTGTLASSVMNDVENLRNLVGAGLFEFVGSVLASILSLGVLLWLSPRLTGVLLGAIAVSAFFIIRGFSRVDSIVSERLRLTRELGGQLNETLSGIRVVKAYCAERVRSADFSATVNGLVDASLGAARAFASLSFAATLVLGVVGMLLMYLGALEIGAGRMSLGDLATYMAFLAYMLIPLYLAVAIGSQLAEAGPSLGRIQQLLNEPSEGDRPERNLTLDHVRGHVVFDRVIFGYEPDKVILHELSFEAGPGRTIAMVGSSGSGKTTTASLIAGFYAPQSGRILVDGVDLSRLRLPSYRRALGIVLQETFLFDGSIRDNVAFARPDATEEEVLAACRAAYVDDFANRLDKGLATLVGERGVKLSGGQRQRVALARAILADPAILILDEATSSLDAESEAIVQRALARLMQGRTTFVIAHRLSTVENADEILVLDQGCIVERGRHSELIRGAGRYSELYAWQRIEENRATSRILHAVHAERGALS